MSIVPVHRYLNWHGQQRPLVGLVLPDVDPLRQLAEPAETKALASTALATSRRLGLDLIAVPRCLAANVDRARDLTALAAASGLAVVLDAGLVTDETIDRLAPIAQAHPRSVIVQATANDDLEDTACALASVHLRLAVRATEPVTPALRASARTADCVSVTLGRDAPRDPASLVTSLLSARVDRPGIVIDEDPDAGSSRHTLAAAFACGHAAYIGRNEDTLAAARALTARMPYELPDPEPEQVAVMVLDQAQQHDSVIGGLLLLQRAAFATPRIVFQDRPDIRAPRLVLVPTRGRLPAPAWTLCWSLAARGSDVCITGQTLETATRERLEDLGATSTGTSHGAVTYQHPSGRGAFHFVATRIELTPRDASAIATLRALARAAGIVEEPWVKDATGHAMRRSLRFANGELRAEIGSGLLDWHDA